jgi:putative ABC transport system permease protein
VRAYLSRAVAKELRAGRALFLLSVAGVALGVASVLSVQLLNQGALGAFAGGVRAVSGEAALTVLGPAGALPEALLDEVLSVPGVRAALPLVRTEIAVEGRPDLGLELVGTDLLAPVRVPWTVPRAGLSGALATPGWIAVTPALAAQAGWRIGDADEVSSGSRRATVRIGALVDLQKVAPLASRRLAVMDVAQAQALLGARGRLHQIDVLAAPGEDAGALAARLSARLGPRARVVSPEQRTIEAAGLLGAFRLNLTALSLVSVLVGGFLVYAATRAALVRRREELGVLRAVGATRAQVLALVLAEAALLGALGTLAGIPLGLAAARANLDAVSGTLRTVYLLEGIERVALGPGLVALAAATGLGGALAGALLPALDAVRSDPRALLSSLTLEEAAGARAAPLLAAGLAALAAGAGVHAAAAGRWPPSGFALALGILVAVPLAAPAAMRALSVAARPRRLGTGWGLRSLGARLPSAAVAAGALAVAVSMLVGVTVMVGSFRGTVERWLAATLRADVYVTTPSWRRARSEAVLAPGIVERLAREPGVVAVDRLRQVQAIAAGRRVSVSGVDAGLPGGAGRVALVSGDRQEAMRRLREEGAVLVSEPLARKAGIAAGGTVAVRGASGEVAFPVAGVYRDYGSEAGAVLMDLGAFERTFGPGAPSNAALFLGPGADPEAVVSRLRAALPEASLVIRSQRTLRGEVLEIFEQTFAVTRLLQAMGLLIAVAGIALALLVLGRERSAETALLRALGATRAQVFLVFVGRGLGIGLLGLALGAAGGAGLALVLVEVVNPAWFGWSLDLAVPSRALAAQAGTILAAAAVASVVPALRASRTPAASLSRDAL